jgi:radical SAM protein with 4Fe4S-binding SPASM domain
MMRDFEARLASAANGYPDVAFRIDCALSFLQRHVTPSRARNVGIKGCVAGDRILALTPDGGAFPCSQLVAPAFHVGNALTGDLSALWEGAQVLRRLRGFRDEAAALGSACEGCAALAQCGGCRVFSADGLGADPGCPDAPESITQSNDGYPVWLHRDDCAM